MKILPILAGVAILAAAPLASAEKGGVAILDIDRVAKELNVDQAVLGELKSIEVDLNAQLTQIRNNLQGRMNQLEAQASQQQTQQAQKQLVAANQQLNQQFNQVKAQAQGKMAAERVKKINEFRDKVRPIAEAAAKERGLDVVLTKSPQVFTFVDAVDITEAVIKGAKAAGLEAEAPPGPPATAPPATSGTGAAPAGDAAKPTTGETPAPATPAKPKGGKGKGN